MGGGGNTIDRLRTSIVFLQLLEVGVGITTYENVASHDMTWLM